MTRTQDRRSLIGNGLPALVFVLAATSALAQDRPHTPSLTCAAVKSLVAARRSVVLATGPNSYETVHLDGGDCKEEVTSAPAFEPTLDQPNCFAGYRCIQRNNDGTGVR